MRLEFVAQGQDCDSGCHFRLNGNGHIQHKLLALLHCPCLKNQGLVAVRASSQISQGGDCMALNFLVVGGAKEIHKRFQEAGLNDRRLIHRMYRDVADAGHSGQYEWKIGGLEQSKQRVQTVRSDDVQLVLLVGSKVAERQSSLTLNLGRGRVHEVDKRLYELWLCLRKLLAVVSIDCDVAECRCAVVLDIDIGRGEKLDEHGYGAGIHELLTVLVFVPR